jgi:signal transduction histidine kinase
MDEDLRRREYILNIILVGSIGMLVILDAIVLFYSLREGSADREMTFGGFSLLPAFFILLYMLFRRGYVDFASYLLIAAYFVSNGYAAYRWGVTMQVVLITYALIIVMATILRGTKFGFFITGLIAIFIIPLGYAQSHGEIVMQVQKARTADVFIFSVLYFLIMTVAWLYNREIERSLHRAKNSEAALKKERDLLEIRVAERTEELRRTQFEKVEQMSRLAELGQLSSGLFHDLLNLLNSLALQIKDESNPSLTNAFAVTKQIEDFTQAVRKQIVNASTKELFSLNKGILHAIQLVNYQANKEHVAIVFTTGTEKDITYLGVPLKFQEIVINLLLNAVESYEYLPRSEVRTRRIVLILSEQDGIIELRAEDNGCGMTPEVRKRIFEPFFSTKKSKGIGIGLSTIKKIIEEDLAGNITVESTPAKGSTFTITFPIKHEGSSDIDRPRNQAYKGTAIP